MPDATAIVDFEGMGRLRFGRPAAIVEATRITEVRDALARVEQWTRDGGWAVGFVSYEAAPAFDPALVVQTASTLPLLWFALVEAPEADEPPTVLPPDVDPPAVWTPDVGRDAHADAVRAIRRAIGRGDVYQVNHTLRLHSRWRGDTRALYETLRAAHRPRFGCWLRTGRHTVVSLSPELFIARDGDRLTTRPMKGTAPRGRFPEEDEARRTALLASEKERAENVMIVDLLRNDLGRIAIPGTVEAPELFAVERYPSVWQLTSTVQGTLRPGITLVDTFAALFPCGSVTGAPKVAAMRGIAALEVSPRGLYCGAIGVVRPGGDWMFSVAIRTLVSDDATGEISYGVGGGITWDSSPDDEYEELLTKGGALGVRRATALIETLRLTEGVYPLAVRHLARLTRSAAHLGLEIDVDAAARALRAHAAEHPGGTWRVRMVAGEHVAPAVTSTPLATDPLVWRFALARTPVDERDVLLFHKTTSRDVYDRHAAEHPNADDVLLWNRAGELTEFTRGNLVLELDGERLTPPVGCGLLAGVRRELLLEQGEIRERVLMRADLARATRVWLVNAVRGWVSMRSPSNV